VNEHNVAAGVVDDESIDSFHRDGFAVLREAFDPSGLSAEVDDALLRGVRRDVRPAKGAGGVAFHSVVMMCEATPVSLTLLDEFAAVASRLLDRRILPGRAKGTRYFGASRLHADSDAAVPSLGFVAYLEPVSASSGALRVVPGSHRHDSASDRSAARVLPTNPGDVIVFDERLTHGSLGGVDRRQWRVDFIADPANETEEALVRATFERIFDPGWDGGDDVDRYPSYGRYWQSLDRPWTERLRELGVYDLAAAHASAVRARRVDTATHG
jgi:hypothetical protein